MKPLQQSLNSKDRTITYTEADIKTLFSNLEVVIPLNVELLKELTTIVGNWSEQQKIGATFLRMAPFLKMYYEYSIAYNTALDTYNRLVRDQNFAQRLLVSLFQFMNSFLVVLTRFFCRIIERSQESIWVWNICWLCLYNVCLVMWCYLQYVDLSYQYCELTFNY